MPGTSSSFRFGKTNVADGLLSPEYGGVTSPAWICHGRDWKPGGDAGAAAAAASPLQSARGKGGSGTSGKSPGRGSPPLSG